MHTKLSGFSQLVTTSCTELGISKCRIRSPSCDLVVGTGGFDEPITSLMYLLVIRSSIVTQHNMTGNVICSLRVLALNAEGYHTLLRLSIHLKGMWSNAKLP